MSDVRYPQRQYGVQAEIGSYTNTLRISPAPPSYRLSRPNPNAQMRNLLDEINDALCSIDSSKSQNGIALLESLLHSLLVQIPITPASPATCGQFAEFIELQNDFEYNFVLRLLQYYRLTFDRVNKKVDFTTVTMCNRLLQGLLLLHPRSRCIFALPANMSLFLSFLDTEHQIYQGCSPIEILNIQTSFVVTLVHILLKTLKNYRIFEECGGCPAIIKLFKLPSTQKDLDDSSDSSSRASFEDQQNLNFKIIEFLIIYLADESVLGVKGVPLKSVSQKCCLFKPHFSGIDSLVENLNTLKIV